MSTSSRSAAQSGAGGVLSSSLFRVVIVGGATLKGKEVSEVLDSRKFPTLNVRLLDDDESLGQLEAVGDEMTFIQSVRADQFEKVDFAFFACDPKTTAGNWSSAYRAGCAIVDLSYALEEETGARIRSPWVERQREQDLQLELQPGPAVVAHPAATVMALLVLRAQKAGNVKRVVATLFQPVSEQGQKGVDELHEQTVNLLSFQDLPRHVFDAQVAFNLVRRFGEAAQPPLETTERMILRHYQQIAGKDAVVPALLTLQAPVFHGLGFALYVEMAEALALGDLAQALNGDHVEITRSAEDTPTNARAAGQEEILVALGRDANHPNGLWIWAAVDNLRIAARTAVECAETLAASRPKGKVQ
jgi:aspartate-semialdehyde dehydrogenase